MPENNLPDVPPAGSPKEPLLTVASATAVTVAVLACLVSFGIRLDDDQQAAVLGLVAALAPFVVALVARRSVWAPRTVRAVVNRAVAQAKSSTLPTTRNTGVFDGPQADGPRELR